MESISAGIERSGTFHASLSQNSSTVDAVIVSNTAPANNRSATAPVTATHPRKRKAPHCKKCNRPCLGHPKSSCPGPPILPTSKVAEAPDMGAIPVEASSVMETAVILNHAQTHTRSKLDNLLLSSTGSTEIEARPSSTGIFHSNESTGLITSELFVQPFADAAAATNLSLANDCSNFKKQISTENCILGAAPDMPLPVSDFSEKKKLLTTSPVPSPKEQHTELEDPAEKPEPKQTVPPHRAPSQTLNSMKSDLAALMISGQAPGTIFVIPDVNAGAILNQADTLKLKTGLAEDKSGDSEHLSAIVFSREDKAFQEFISATMASSVGDRSAPRSRGGLSVFKIAAVAVLGAIGAWTALAFV